MIVGRVRIHKKRQKKGGKIYEFRQAVIYVKKKYLDRLIPLDDKEVTLFLEGEQQRSELEEVLVDLFTKAFNDDEVKNLLLSKFMEDVKRVLELLEGRKG